MDELLDKINAMRTTVRVQSRKPLLLALDGAVQDDGQLRAGAPWWACLELRADGQTQVRWNSTASVQVRVFPPGRDAESVSLYRQMADTVSTLSQSFNEGVPPPPS